MAVLPVRRLGECTRGWEGTGDPNGPVGYSTPYDLTVNNKNGGVGEGGGGGRGQSWLGGCRESATAQGLAGQKSAANRQWHYASLDLYIF